MSSSAAHELARRASLSSNSEDVSPSVSSDARTTHSAQSTESSSTRSSPALSLMIRDDTEASHSVIQAQPAGAETTGKTKKLPTELKVKKLPSVKEIRKMIPAKGLDIRDLARKLNIDHTNYWLFLELMKLMCDMKIRSWVKPSSAIPSPAAVEEIYEVAKKPAARRELLGNQVIAAKLHGDIKITWDEHAELARSASKILPQGFYRVFYEDSATLTPYVTRHTHPKHRERLGLTISDKVAFQSIGKFSVLADLTRNRIERHLVWNQKCNPSSFISVSDSIDVARKRAIFHSPDGKSHRIGERIAIAHISTKGLRPVTIHADLEESIRTIKRDEFGLDKFVDGVTESRPVQIPAWIHDDAFVGYEDRSSMSLEELEASIPEIWLSITELRHCNLKVPASRGHDYEWLAAGTILKKRVRNIMPFDGKTLHRKKGPQEVRSKSSEQCWVWNWNSSTWFLDTSRDRRRHTDELSNNSNDAGDTRTGTTMMDGDEINVSDVNDENVGGEDDLQIHEAKDMTNTKRSDTTEEHDIGHLSKRPRISTAQDTADKPVCRQSCSACCVRDMNDENTAYVAAWKQFLKDANIE